MTPLAMAAAGLQPSPARRRGRLGASRSRSMSCRGRPGKADLALAASRLQATRRVAADARPAWQLSGVLTFVFTTRWTLMDDWERGADGCG
jgi:hypothetical protein